MLFTTPPSRHSRATSPYTGEAWRGANSQPLSLTQGMLGKVQIFKPYTKGMGSAKKTPLCKGRWIFAKQKDGGIVK